jgi:hypothetical protein
MFVVSMSFSDILEDADMGFGLGANKEYKPTLSIGELVNIYKGRKVLWDDHTRISVFVRPYRDIVQKGFLGDILGMSPSTFKEYVEVSPNIKVVKKRDIFLEMTKVKGSLGILGPEEIYISTDYGIKLVDVVED